MQISNIFGYKDINTKKNNTTRADNSCHLSPLRYDTVSFGALKKNQFHGIDLLVVNKFKAPIEKFNTNDDLQNWCNEKVEGIIKTDYKGRRQETVVQRKAMLKEWVDYVQKENDAYTPAIQLLILDGVTKDLEPDEDTIPPVLNKGILAQTIEEIQNKLKINTNTQINFSKQYQMNLQKSMLQTEGEEKIENITGWIVIPSQENAPEHFEENVEKLKLLSHHNWCTKSFNAEPYLSNGDFHVYLENGKPKLGVRFAGDEIQEIQGERNNSKIPVKYLDIAKEHVSEFKLADKTKQEFEAAEKAKEKANEILKKLPQGINNATPQEIFKAFGIDAKKDDDGLLIITEYRQPDESLSFEDFDIDENELFKSIKIIEGNADFRELNATNLGNLQMIGGNAIFWYSNITDLGKLQTIGGNVRFNDSKITNLGQLQTIGGNAKFNDSKITNLGQLQTIGGSADFTGAIMEDLGNLETIGNHAFFCFSRIKSLGKLQSIGGMANFRRSLITDLGNLKSIKYGCGVRVSQTELIKNLKERNIAYTIA